jgi:succinate dehydrogenase / fumarate reductase iron-sulfur subunit
MVDYQIDGIEPDMSFLEMLDVFNEDLMSKGGEPVAFDHDCRERICGMCSLYINGEATDLPRVTTCQLRTYVQGCSDTLPSTFPAAAFPVVKI